MTIHSLRLDQDGNVLDAPPTYRQFFMDEVQRSIGLLMCAIIDANVCAEVFGDGRTPRGQILYEWLTRGRTGRLVVGGKLLRELCGSSTVKAWACRSDSSRTRSEHQGCNSP